MSPTKLRFRRPCFRQANTTCLNHGSGFQFGFTLVELLVVIGVISLLAAIALPNVKASLREQKVKRAATLVQSFFDLARAKAIGTGRSAGVVIDRRSTANLQGQCESIRLRLADTPSDYTGDSGAATVIPLVRVNPPTGTMPANSTANDQISLWFRDTEAQMIRSASDILAGTTPTLINIGDIAYLGDAGLPLRILAIRAAASSDFSNFGQPVLPIPMPAPSWTIAIVERVEPNLDLRRVHRVAERFLIRRQPRPAIALPSELPVGTVIDLSASGMGRQGNQLSPMEIAGNYITNTGSPIPAPFGDGASATVNILNYQSIWVMFGPRGNLDQIFYSTYAGAGTPPILVPHAITGDLHLLVGRGGQVKVLPEDQLEDNDAAPLNDEASDGKSPILDPDSVWVTIRARSGESTAASWALPTIDPRPTALTNALQRNRVQNTIGRTRELAVLSRDGGSL